ncbi:MAG: Na+-dependent transporter [Labilithrix sp.]|nr:Na+-dependent transporter [Labilithrix sp.]
MRYVVAPPKIHAVVHALQRRLLWLLLATYVLAAVLPRAGLALRTVTFGTAHWVDGSSIALSLPLFMLALLLFDAAVVTQAADVRRLLAAKRLLLLGVVANVALPIAYAVAVGGLLAKWPERDEVESILVGLALVGAMPIAGSSTAWSQNIEGNVTLSLALVLFSTLLSPVTTPIVLHAVGMVTTGDYSEDLHELAASGGGAFIAVSVVLPSVLGLIVHRIAGKGRVARALPYIKAVNLIDLLLLNYSNASLALPEAFRILDWDFLALTLAIAAVLCAVAFFVGWTLPRLTKGAPMPDRIAMMFGLGMNNNGAGLVLASMALADHPHVALPIVFYNLVQQGAAGIASAWVERKVAAAYRGTR